MRFSSTEVPENKKTKHHCHFALLWGSATVSFLTWGENETKKKGAVYKTHTFFTHAVKKTRDTNRNDVKNVLRRKIKQNKKRKTFHAEIWTAGWTNIKSVRARRSHVCRLEHARRFFLGETCNLFVFNMTSKTHWSISGYMERCGVVLKRLKHKTYWRCHKAQSVGGEQQQKPELIW